MMHEERRWFVGIDWASQEHVVKLCDGDGENIGERWGVIRPSFNNLGMRHMGNLDLGIFSPRTLCGL
jgi:hypothetical protein